MKASAWSVCLVVAALLAMAGGAAAGEVEDQAVKVAKKWLELVDAGEYRESWRQAASLFRGAVTEPQWKAALEGSRTPLGAMKSRRLKAANFATELPGAPDGEYVVIQFESSFENRKSAVETVTPMKDKDGEWRVSGYFVR
jgi:hypothetical protein